MRSDLRFIMEKIFFSLWQVLTLESKFWLPERFRIDLFAVFIPGDLHVSVLHLAFENFDFSSISVQILRFLRESVRFLSFLRSSLRFLGGLRLNGGFDLFGRWSVLPTEQNRCQIWLNRNGRVISALPSLDEFGLDFVSLGFDAEIGVVSVGDVFNQKSSVVALPDLLEFENA